MKRTPSSLLLGIGLLMASACGCSGGKGPKVTGSVTLNGQPLADAQVVFEPVTRKSGLGGAVTRTDQDGKFEVRPQPKSGQTLKPGKYVVLITKLVDKNGNVPSAEEFAQLQRARALRNTLPPRYNDKDFPQFPVDIKEGDNHLPPFAVKSK
jgi:hypothetical protein